MTAISRGAVAGRRGTRTRRPRRHRVRGRLVLLWVVTLIGFGALVFRAASLQVSPPERLQAANEEAREQRLAEETLPAPRGSIFDRNGAELSISVQQSTIVANAQAVADPVAAAAALAPILQKDPAVLQQQLSNGRAFVYLARQVDDDTAAKIEALRKEPGFGFLSTIAEAKRFNPSGNELALSVLGRTDIDGKGISGLEAQFEDRLRGIDGEAVMERGTRNRTIPGGTQLVTAATPGTSLVLALDRGLQYETEKILMRAVDEQKAKGGTVIVSNPHTGEVLASANVIREEGYSAKPSVDNRALTWTFEPGSINKTLTMAGVLEEGLATPDTERLISANITSYEMEFTDEGRSADQVMTPTDILRMSSNNGTVTWAQDLGKDKLWSYFNKFGLGKRTTDGFPGEAVGTLRPVKNWDDVSFRTMAYGLGLSATPMQMLDAYNTIANGGVTVPTRFVLGTQDASGVFTPDEVAAGTRVVSQATADGLTRMLTSVVAGGTGAKAAVAGYTVAGKTGTAWKALETGGYGYPGARKLVVSFVGFLPAADPQLSIIVVLDEPVDQNASGGKVAAPVFRDVASFAVRQLRVPPDGEAAAPKSNKERVRAQPTGAEPTVTAPLVFGPPAPVSTTTAPKATTTTAPKATTTTAPKATTTTAPKAPTTTAPKAPTTVPKVASGATGTATDKTDKTTATTAPTPGGAR